MAKTAHALVDGLINYELAVYGTHRRKNQREKEDGTITSRAVRKVIGTSVAVLRVMMKTLTDTGSFGNHFMLKEANIVDRAFRENGTDARNNIIRVS